MWNQIGCLVWQIKFEDFDELLIFLLLSPFLNLSNLILQSGLGSPKDSCAATRGGQLYSNEWQFAARFANILLKSASMFFEVKTDQDMDVGPPTDKDSDWNYRYDEDECVTNASKIHFDTSALSFDQLFLQPSCVVFLHEWIF